MNTKPPTRYLYRVDNDELIAYSTARRDFVHAENGTLWAHESHGWLLDARTGAEIAHRTGAAYYCAKTGEPLYYESTEAASDSTVHITATTA